MSNENQTLQNEVDEPSIGAVYIILVLAIITVIISIIGLSGYENIMNEIDRKKIEQAPTVELNTMNETNASRMAIVNKTLNDQAATQK